MCFIPGAQNNFHIAKLYKFHLAPSSFKRSKHMMCLGKYKRQKEIQVFVVLTFAHLLCILDYVVSPWPV